MKTGERIRIRRLELSLSQEDLAKKVGLKDKSSISKIENGSPNLDTVRKFASALGCSVAYLMGWEQANRIPVLGRVTAGIPIEANEGIYASDFTKSLQSLAE